MDFGKASWPAFADLGAPLVLLPLGAVEAHGPHLPLEADTLLAVALAQRCARSFTPEALVAPPFTATAASFAASFPGTVSIPPATEQRALLDTLRALRQAGAGRVVLVNLHFDPEHMTALRGALSELDQEAPGFAVFPDFTRRAQAQRIGGEFATGACHAGQFETSLMLAVAPHLVDASHRALPALDVNLAVAIRAGCQSFREAGLDQAYCGNPAAASAEEGARLLDVLAEIALEACR